MKKNWSIIKQTIILVLFLSICNIGISSETRNIFSLKNQTDDELFSGYTCVSNEHSGFRIAKDRETEVAYLINSFGSKIVTLVNADFDENLVIEKIRNSEIPDRILIVRILEMYTERIKKINELVNLTCTYDSIEKIMIEHIYNWLTNKFTESEIKKFTSTKKDLLR